MQDSIYNFAIILVVLIFIAAVVGLARSKPRPKSYEIKTNPKSKPALDATPVPHVPTLLFTGTSKRTSPG